MNVERLHAIALTVKTENEKLQVIQLVSQIVSGLQQQINQPQQPQFQEQVSNSRIDLRKNLMSAKSNEFSPAWNQTIQELGIYPLLGNRLIDSIDNIFLQNQITPQVAMQEMQTILDDLQTMSTSLENMIAGFNHFNIGREVLEPGEAELGILLPRAYLDNRFDKLSKELKQLNSILSVFSEVSTGSIEHYEIKSLSTSDPFIVLGASLGVLSTIAISVKPIISAYKEILEVRLLHAKLTEKNISNARLKGIEEHAEEIMEKVISEVKEELLSKYPLDDEARKNELSNALGPALKKVANRIDRGFNIEIRVEPIEEKEETDVADEIQQNIESIQSAMSDMEYIKLEGDPILHLLESSNGEDDEE